MIKSKITSLKHLDLKFTLYTDKGSERAENQDSIGYKIAENYQAFIIADGLGGGKGGSTASHLAVRNILKKLITSIERNKDYILQIINETNSLITEHAKKHEDLENMSTTLAAVFINDPEIYIAHVGDSRVYKITEKEVLQITRDHSLLEDLKSKGEILNNEVIERFGHVLSSSLGQAEDLRIDFNNLGELKPNEKYLICSDGVYQHLSSEVLHRILNKKSGSEAVSVIRDYIFEDGATDNFSIILLEPINKLEHSKEEEFILSESCLSIDEADEVNQDSDLDESTRKTKLIPPEVIAQVILKTQKRRDIEARDKIKEESLKLISERIHHREEDVCPQEISTSKRNHTLNYTLNYILITFAFIFISKVIAFPSPRVAVLNQATNFTTFSRTDRMNVVNFNLEDILNVKDNAKMNYTPSANICAAEKEESIREKQQITAKQNSSNPQIRKGQSDIYYVQIAARTILGELIEIEEQLKANHFNTYLKESTVNNTKYYRLLVGKYENSSEAQKIVKKIKDLKIIKDQAFLRKGENF